MQVHEKIRVLREIKQWSQEEMAEKLAMSPNGYAKIERGKTHLNLDRLTQIAEIFDIELVELVSTQEKTFFLSFSNNQSCLNSYVSDNNSLVAENEKLALIIAHKDELLAQKDKEIQMLKELVQLLKK